MKARAKAAGEPLSVVRVERCADVAAVAFAAASHVVDAARTSLAERGRFSLVLSGGSTPGHLYRRLAAEQPPRVAWDQVDFFFGDERAVPVDHADSNHRFAFETLLGPIQAAPDRIHRIRGEAPDLVAASNDYQRELAGWFGVDPAGEPPRFDLVLLGMGADGHTASLFPHSTAISENDRWVVSHHPAGLAPRITLTMPILERAREVLFLVTGSDKAETLAAVLSGPRRPLDLPAQAVVPADGTVTWLVDEAAAASLPRSETTR